MNFNPRWYFAFPCQFSHPTQFAPTLYSFIEMSHFHPLYDCFTSTQLELAAYYVGICCADCCLLFENVISFNEKSQEITKKQMLVIPWKAFWRKWGRSSAVSSISTFFVTLSKCVRRRLLESKKSWRCKDASWANLWKKRPHASNVVKA